MALHLIVFGANGQVGSALRALDGPGLRVTALSREQADLAHPGASARLIETTDADIVINAAAFTHVDGAETQPELAMRINADAPGAMADAAARRGVPFLHVSTDHVFNGTGERAWTEGDIPAPLNVYGHSKRQGELAVQSAGGQAAILRTSWVHDRVGQNFVNAMLRAAGGKAPIRVVDDQWGGPTSASSVAAALCTMARAFANGTGRTGVYHFAGAPDATWFDFASQIFRQAGLHHRVSLIPIPAADWAAKAPRPRNSRLDCSRIARVFGIQRPDWRKDLATMLGDGHEAAA